MTTHLTEDRLHGYANGSLDAAARSEADAHLATCASCRAEVEGVRALLEAVRALPRTIEPERDLWGGVEERLRRGTGEGRTGKGPWGWWVALPLAALLVVALGIVRWTTTRPVVGWPYSVARGQPLVDGAPAPADGVLRRGSWMETGAGDSVRLRVGEIGLLALGPGSRVRLAAAGPKAHRLTLVRGAVYAEVTAPPRLFVVETPAAVATDLGCAYTLAVDSLGAGLLHVTSGWVELARGSRIVVVPYDAYAPIDARRGPGTPYAAGAPPALRAALDAFDAETGGDGAVRAALAAARPADALSLMNLLARTEGALRAAVFDRLAALAPPPPGVERDAVLGLDEATLNRWWDAIRPPRLERDAGAFLEKKKRMRLSTPRAVE